MTEQIDGLPVLVIDGASFSDFDGFAREFSRLLCNYSWQGNLDAFNDLLRGGFGTPEDGRILRWLIRATLRSVMSLSRLPATMSCLSFSTRVCSMNDVAIYHRLCFSGHNKRVLIISWTISGSSQARRPGQRGCLPRPRLTATKTRRLRQGQSSAFRPL
jgi:hypothetical protein